MPRNPRSAGTPRGIHLSIVVPLFNESGTFDELHRRLSAVLLVLGLDHEIIYVDDGSTDDTPATIARQFPEVRLISQRNQGRSIAKNTAAFMNALPESPGMPGVRV